ncbi:AraC family transcriptional regulator [Pedobacter sp. ASV12]|uniref:AraC family transcriptional regulator n=1 Tax=Pedobacter sp. ASV12 TaxID=2795120 RepID=UPI0018EA3AA2|nr:AraC family transcriptional regulator [Pedobacter sp. ASV12]
MRPVFAKILEGSTNEVYKTKVVDSPYFSTTFHFHVECQMSYIVESSGRRIIGDSIGTFEHDELTFIGANLPHVWYNDERYFEAVEPSSHARSVTLFFDSDKLIAAFEGMVSMQKLKSILQIAQRGMKFFGQTKDKLKALLLQMAAQEEGIERMILLLKILDTLSNAEEYELLSGLGYTNNYQLKDNNRMDKVFKYVFANFSDEIQLDTVSALINMNKQAFCRYFKSRTQKTFVEFVNEVRISHACKLMADGEQQISSLAYACGFNSLSNFNRFFKEAKGITPREYKKIMADNKLAAYQ